MATHHFIPRLRLRGSATDDVVQLIDAFERGSLEGSPGAETSGGAPLPAFPASALARGEEVVRHGRLRSEGKERYRLRVKKNGETVSLGWMLAGVGCPSEVTAGGGALLRGLLRGLRLRVHHDALTGRVEEIARKADVRDLMDHLLSLRGVPTLVVSCRASGDLAVPPHGVAPLVAGMAHVWWLSTPEASFAMRDAFVDRGLSEKWNCYDGGVRIYRRRFDPESDLLREHPLLLHRSIQEQDDAQELVVARWGLPILAEDLGESEWTEEWESLRDSVSWSNRGSAGDVESSATLGDVLGSQLRDLVAADAAVDVERGETASVVVPGDEPPTHPVARTPLADAPVEEPPPLPVAAPSPAVKPPSIAPPAPDAPEAGETPPARASSARPVSGRPRGLAAALQQVHTSLEALAAIDGHLAELEEDRRLLVSERDELRGRVYQLEQELQDARETRLLPRTVAEAVELAEQLFGGRLDITPYAKRHADKSGYRHPALVGHVLACIALGAGDFKATSELVAPLGGRVSVSPTESTATMNTFGNRRRFPVGDELVECQQHATLGGGTRNPAATLHVYFTRRGERALVLYVGEHLPTVSENT